MSSAGATTAAALYALVSITTPTPTAAKPDDADEKQHHVKNGKGFVNPWPSWHEPSPFRILYEILSRKISGQGNSPDVTPPTVPVRKPTFLPSRHTPKLRSTWLGHACFYVEFPSGLRVLFDPVFEDCCAPINLPNLKRHTPPACEIEDLPAVDAVVISHNHYDHLSHPTVMRIFKKFPDVQFFVPLGNQSWFAKCGIHNVTELDWWDAREMKLEIVKDQGNKDAAGDLKAAKSSISLSSTDNSSKPTGSGGDPSTILATITCLPCQHTTARTLWDRNHTLWASWAIQSGGSSVYFAGDTGYRAVPKLTPASAHPKINSTDPVYPKELLDSLPTCPAFREIGQHVGPFDLGLIPIGAYGPRFVFSSMHACPEDSVQIFLETKCRRALGMHWGTWVLTEENWDDPPNELRKALREAGVEKAGPAGDEEEVFGVCDIGESREFESLGR